MKLLCVAWWRWENRIQHKILEQGLNITLFGKRRGKKGSEHSVKVEEKSRGQIPEGGKCIQFL